MAELKDPGTEIVYNEERLSYVYNNDVKINIHLKIGQIDKNQIRGGNSSNYFDPLPYLAVKGTILVFDSYWGHSPNPLIEEVKSKFIFIC